MKIVYVGGDSGTDNVTDMAAATDPVTWPAIRPGDFALVAWAFQSTATATDLQGFGQIDSQTNGNQNALLLGRVCTGAESGNIAFKNSIQNKQGICLSVYRGTHKTAPVQAGDFSFLLETSPTKTSHASPSETLQTADCAAVTIITERASPASSSFTVPSGYTKRQEIAGTGGGATTVTMADDGLAVDRASGASVTPGPWTGTILSQNNIMWTVLLRPHQHKGWGVHL